MFYFDNDECGKIRRRKKLDIIDVGVVFIVIFRIVDDLVAKNKKLHHCRIIVAFAWLLVSMTLKNIIVLCDEV